MRHIPNLDNRNSDRISQSGRDGLLLLYVAINEIKNILQTLFSVNSLALLSFDIQGVIDKVGNFCEGKQFKITS